MGSEVSLLARKIRLVMTVVLKSRITRYSLDPVVLTSIFFLFCLTFIVFFVRESFFIFKCAYLGASKFCNLHLKLCISAIYSMQNYKIFYPSVSIIVVTLTLNRVMLNR